jgi:hypothetical protein
MAVRVSATPRPLYFYVAIVEYRYSSTLPSTSAVNMAVGVSAKPRPLYYYVAIVE